MKRISWVACPKCKDYTDQKVRRSDRNSKHVIVRRRECFECGQADRFPNPLPKTQKVIVGFSFLKTELVHIISLEQH